VSRSERRGLRHQLQSRASISARAELAERRHHFFHDLQDQMMTILLPIVLVCTCTFFLIYHLNATFTCDSIPTCSKCAHLCC